MLKSDAIKLTATRSLIPDMDHHVKRMLKLIDEDADSFTKKVEIYYQKRPELISLVEDVYRMYRSLAERYDHVTSDLRKTVPSDLQSQCSGITDIGSEPPSTMPSPGPSRRQSGHRSPGFDYFLGNHAGIGSDAYVKEGDESSSESESEDSSVQYYSGIHSNEEERRKILELEVEKRRMHDEAVGCESLFRSSSGVESFEKIGKYEFQLRAAKEKILQSEEEIRRLNSELRKYRDTDYLSQITMEVQEVQELGGEVLESERKILTLWEEHRLTREKLRVSEQDVARLKQELASKAFPLQNLQDQLKLAQKEISDLQSEVDEERAEVARYKKDLAERDQEMVQLKEAISVTDKSLTEENEKLREEIFYLSRERCCLEDNLKEVELRCLYLEEEMRGAFGFEMEQLRIEIRHKNREIEELKTSLEELQAKHDVLENEKDELNINIFELGRELTSKDDQIDQMSSHLQQMQVEQMELVASAEAARKVAEELRLKIKELEREVEKKQQIIVQGAEEKREAIRQLCFSLEHYRNGYHRLREVVTGSKAVAS